MKSLMLMGQLKIFLILCYYIIYSLYIYDDAVKTYKYYIYPLDIV